ncbi:uncharacterized protein LOC135155717 [Lytechinus pictus]|uniref:uncharacterized protein LOC135155717 n=1 Tax=Lytechinus pictus TaxID=7653 RepID=UPI0030BA0761
MAPRKNRNVRGQKAKKRPPDTPQQSQVAEESSVPSPEDAETEDRPIQAPITAQPHDSPCVIGTVRPGSTAATTSITTVITATNFTAGSTSTASTAATPASADEDDDEDETEKGRDTDGENAQPPAKRRRKAPRPPVVLSEEEMVEVAEFLKENDSLYNKSRDLWRDTQARARLWDQQGQAMDKTGLELQQWYESLRTKLGRLKKKAQKSGSGAEVLTDLQERIEARGQAPREEEEEEEDQERGVERQVEPAQPENQEEATTNQQSLDGASKESTPFPRGSRYNKGKAPQKSPRQQETDVLDHLIKNQQNSEQLMALSAQVLRTLDRPQSQHPDREQFTNYVGSVLQQLPDDLYRKANRLLSNLLLDIQDEASTRRQDSLFMQHRHTSLQPPSDPPIARPGTSSGVSQPPCGDGWQPPPHLWPTNPVSTSVWHSMKQSYMANVIPGMNDHSTPSYTTMQPRSASAPSLSAGRSSRESSDFSMTSFLASLNDSSQTPQQQQTQQCSQED